MTPDELRHLTSVANKGFASKRQAQEEAQIQDTVNRAIRDFPVNAQVAAAEGRNSVDVYEMQGDYKSIDDVSPHAKEVMARLKKHFEAQGFKTRVYGPYSEAWVGGGCWDLMVEW